MSAPYLTARQRALAKRALERAIKIAGGPAALARALSRDQPITPQAIIQWSVVSTHRARRVSELTNVPLYELRPDLWDRPAPIAGKMPPRRNRSQRAASSS